MTSTDRATGAGLLRQLRESRGWSWADLARALRGTARRLGVSSLTHCQVASIQRTIARWESAADRTSPGDRYQFLLAHLYAHTPSGGIALGPGSDLDVLLDALRHFGTSQHRIGQLVELVTRSATNDGAELLALLPPVVQPNLVSALREPSRLDPGLLGQLAGTVATINAQVGSVPFVRLQILLAPIVQACHRLIGTDHSPRPREELLMLATDVFALAGRLAFETRDDDAAMPLYREATDTAGRLRDRRHRAIVRTSHAMVTLHATANVEAARRIARAAIDDAHDSASYAIRARAHAVYAEVCARAGHRNQAHAELERARKTIDQVQQDGQHGGFNGDRLDGFEGLCALYTGDADHACDRLARSVATLDQPRDAVQRGIVSTDLALALLRLGDPAACVDLLHGAVDVTASTDGRVPAQRIRQTRQELRPWRTEGFLADLDDHIHDALIGR